MIFENDTHNQKNVFIDYKNMPHGILHIMGVETL